MASKYCPKCQQRYPSPARICAADQEILSLNDPYHLVGRLLMEKYRIDALVGLGGMGAVYCAYHLGIDRRVALKILQPNLASADEQLVSMFEREAKLAGRLEHENIIDVKDAGRTAEGISYIVMEWLEGNTLDEELTLRGRLGFLRAAGITRQIAIALAEAHKRQIIHRDLKPGNVMLVGQPDGRELVKVLDFGISKALNHTSGAAVSAIVGTPHYASPEQLTYGGHIDGRSDIYSLGIILYRTLSGQVPFKCNSMGELIQLQMTHTPPPLSRLRPETPPEFDRLVSRMIARDPAERPLNAGEVINLIDHAISYSQISGEDDVPATIPTGETTIIRNQGMTELTTEEMPVIAPPPKREIEAVDYATSVLPQTTRRGKSYLLLGSTIVAVLTAGGYGLYRFAADPVKDSLSASSGKQVSHGTPPPPSPVASATVEPAARVSPTHVEAVEPKPEVAHKAPKGAGAVRRERLAEGHFREAQIFYQQNKFPEARSEARKALKLNPKHAQAIELERRTSHLIRILKNR